MKNTLSAKLFLLTFILLLVPNKGIPAEDLVTSTWRSAPLNIDGSPGDWGNVLMNSPKKISMDCAFMNDADNLFVIFKVTDKKDLSSINFTGLTLWFNTDGKKKKYYGITFKKKAVTADFYLAYLEEQGQIVSDEDKQKILSMSSILFYEASVTNKKSKSTAPPPKNIEIKPAIFRSTDLDRLKVYELSVPLARVTDMSPGLGTEPGSTVKICFEWGGMTDELRKRNIDRQMGSGGRSTGAADERSGGGRGGSGGTVPRQTKPPKKYSVWMDVQLAKK